MENVYRKRNEFFSSRRKIHEYISATLVPTTHDTMKQTTSGRCVWWKVEDILPGDTANDGYLDGLHKRRSSRMILIHDTNKKRIWTFERGKREEWKGRRPCKVTIGISLFLYQISSFYSKTSYPLITIVYVYCMDNSNHKRESL